MPRRGRSVAIRNIGGSSGIEESIENVTPALEILFSNLRQELCEQLKEQQRQFEARLEADRLQREEREQAAASEREARMEERIARIENQCQVLSDSLRYSLLNSAAFSSVEHSEARVNSAGTAVNNVNSVYNASVPIVPSVPVFASQSVPSLPACRESTRFVTGLGYSVKPTRYDGSTSWDEYRIQFEMVANVNGWDEAKKAAALIASLDGPARGVLTSLPADKYFDFKEIVSAIEFRFGQKNFSKLNYVLFQNYKQRQGESISALATEIERLAQCAFSECPMDVRDRLAASQFVTALANEEMKRMLRYESLTSLRATVTRALEMEALNKLSSQKTQTIERNLKRPFTSEGMLERAAERHSERVVGHQRELPHCWSCGKKGHLQRDCLKKIRKETSQGNFKKSV
nr:uncharacterized protein LOC117223138 [Megalopta genalis]